jgi:hypothetical protein
MTMKLDKDKIKGGAFLALAFCFMMGGSWLLINAREGTFKNHVVTHNFADIAKEIDDGSPASSGAGIIIGANYSEETETFTFDMRGNPEILGELPDGMFALIAEGQLTCNQQSDALIDMNKEVNIQYRIYDREGSILSIIPLEKGQCSELPTLPTWVGRDDKKDDSAYVTW